MSAARAGGPSGSTPLLSTANSRITMSIPISSSSSDQPPSFNGHTAASSSRSKIPSFHPGNILRATVKLSESSSNDYTAPIALFLVGSTTVNIMGNDRWQAGAQANIGGGGGSGMLITSMETHEFLRTPFVLLSSDSAREDVQEKAEKVEVHRGKGKGVAYGGGIYEAVLPGIEGFVAPTIVKSLDDLAGVSLRYHIELLGERKGLFKQNDRLSIDLPVTIPRHPLRKDAPYSQVSESRDLKFKAAEGSPFVTATISHRPLSCAAETLDFLLTLLPSPGAASLLPSSTPPTIVMTLSRRVRTTPIDRPGNGKEFHWAGINLGRGTMEELGAEGMTDEEMRSGVRRWVGKIKVPKGHCTVETKGLGIRYMIGATISHSAFTSSLAVKLPIFLPSSADVLDEDDNNENEPGEILDQLPGYVK